MAQNITLLELRTLCRLDAEIPDSITDPELTTWINQAARELTAFVYDINPKWGLSSDTITLDGSDGYDLPATCYKLQYVYLGAHPNGKVLNEVSISQRSLFDGRTTAEYPAYYPTGDEKITVLPTATTGTLTVYFSPTLSAMSDDTDTFNGRFGWEEYIVNRVGLRYAKRNGEPTEVWERDLAATTARIDSQIANLNLSQPLTARNVEGERLQNYNGYLWK